MMSDRVQIQELTHDVDKAFVPSPASPYSSITTTTLSFASSSCHYSSTPYSSISSPSSSPLLSASSSPSPSSPLLSASSSPSPSSSLQPSSPLAHSPSSSSSTSSSLPPHPSSASSNSSPSSLTHSSSTSSLSSSSSSSTIPLTPPPTPPTVSGPSCQMTFREAVQNGNTMELQRLLEEREGKINVNLFDREGQTALHHVCLKGNLELVKLLVKFGADVGLANRDGWNPLHIAAYSGHADILVYLATIPRRKTS